MWCALYRDTRIVSHPPDKGGGGLTYNVMRLSRRPSTGISRRICQERLNSGAGVFSLISALVIFLPAADCDPQSEWLKGSCQQPTS